MPCSRLDAECIKVDKEVSHLKNLEATHWGFSIVLTRILSQLCPQLDLGQLTLRLWVSVVLSGNQGIGCHNCPLFSSSGVLDFYLTVLHGLR